MTKLPRPGLGAFTLFSESQRSSDRDLLTEAGASHGDFVAPNWPDQIFETSLSLDTDWQLESLLCSLAPQSVSLEEMKVETAPEIPQPPVPPSSFTLPSAPQSPESSDSSYHHLNSAVPRHKRPSHKRAELKRRDKIKARLDEVKAQVPSMADKGKMSECAILKKAAEYTKDLLGDCERFSTEAGNLRREIESLRSEIHSLHQQLPASGLKQETVERSQCSMEKLCRDYAASSIKDNWKFYLFNFMMQPLFKTYKEEVSTDNVKSFAASVEEWTNTRMSLSSLRPQTLENMREIARQTDIMNHPGSLPKQALASVAHLSQSVTLGPSSKISRRPKPAASAIPSPEVPCQPSTVPVAPLTNIAPMSTPLVFGSSTNASPLCTPVAMTSFTNVHHLSSPTLTSFTNAHQLSSPTLTSFTDAHQLSSPTLTSFTNIGQLSTPLVLTSSTSHHLSAPVTVASSSNNHLPVQLTLTPSPDLRPFSAPKSSFPSFSSPQISSALPTFSLSLESPSFTIPRTTAKQNLARFSPPGTCKPSTSINDEVRNQNQHRLPKPGLTSTRKRSSGVHIAGAEREGEQSARKRESLDRPRSPIAFNPLRILAAAKHSTTDHPQSVVSLEADMNDISQLAASVEETSLHMNTPIAVVTPSPSLTTTPVAVVIPNLTLQQQQQLLDQQLPSTTVAHLLTDTQCHEYDFDLTDIPLMEDL